MMKLHKTFIVRNHDQHGQVIETNMMAVPDNTTWDEAAAVGREVFPVAAEGGHFQTMTLTSVVEVSRRNINQALEG